MWTVIKWLVILGVANVISEQASIQSNMDKNLIFVFLVGGAVLLKFVFREPVDDKKSIPNQNVIYDLQENRLKSVEIEEVENEDETENSDEFISCEVKQAVNFEEQTHIRNDNILKSHVEVLNRPENLLDSSFNKNLYKKLNSFYKNIDRDSLDFTELGIMNYIRIFTESYDIMQKTKDISTLSSRFDTALLNACRLKKLEDYGVRIGYQNSKYYSSLLLDNYKPCIIKCYHRNLAEVTTEKGKQSRHDKFIKTLYTIFDKEQLKDILSELEVTPSASKKQNHQKQNHQKEDAIILKKIEEAPRTQIATFNQISPNMNEDVLKLLWFYDGDFKNISKDENEPSAISTKLELEEGTPEELGYYPSYEKMTPKQRNYYLDWLTDVRKPIDIGYVFTFYYGLERHLVYGNYKDAIDMILLLRQHHNNHSFQSYSQDALIISIALHNDYSIIDRIDIRTLRDDVKASVIAFTKRKFSAENIIEFSKLTGFKNDRYIKNESELFLKTLNSKINGEFIIEDKHLDNCDFLTLAIANYRLDKRFSQMVDVLSNKILKEELYNLLLETHEDVKSQLKEIRKQEKNNSKKIIDVSEEEIEKIIDISEEKLKKIIEEEIAYRSQSEDFEMER